MYHCFNLCTEQMKQDPFQIGELLLHFAHDTSFAESHKSFNIEQMRFIALANCCDPMLLLMYHFDASETKCKKP